MEHFILAAGKSSRIFDKIKINKCLIKINKFSLIKNIVFASAKFKINKIKVVTGFKQHLIKKHLNNKKIKFIYNKYYSSRDMMYSFYLALKESHQDILITYSDIYYSPSVIGKLISEKKNDAIYIPILKNWKKIWKIRNKLEKNDAEELQIDKNDYITKIGQSTTKNNLPEFQFMGIVYIPKELKKKVISQYLKLSKNKKLQTTHFLNYLIKNKIKVKSIKIKNKWYEFDDYEDLYNFRKLKW